MTSGAAEWACSPSHEASRTMGVKLARGLFSTAICCGKCYLAASPNTRAGTSVPPLACDVSNRRGRRQPAGRCSMRRRHDT